jgi:protein involved in polysaccharide export with SLBB domain
MEGNVLTQNSLQNLPPLTQEGNQIFGLNILRSSAKTFTVSPSIDDKQYISGAGEVLMISLWDQLRSTQEATIDDEGRITLSTVGTILVSGYTIQDAKKKIMIALSRSYSGLVNQPPTILMDLSLSKLRSILVFIIGEVSNTGGYFVNNCTNVFNLLFVVGDQKSFGSLCDVRKQSSNSFVAFDY